MKKLLNLVMALVLICCFALSCETIDSPNLSVTVEMTNDFNGSDKYFEEMIPTPTIGENVSFYYVNFTYKQLVQYWESILADETVTYSKQGIRRIINVAILKSLSMTSVDEFESLIENTVEQIRNLMLTEESLLKIKQAYAQNILNDEQQEVKVSKYFGKFNGMYVFEICSDIEENSVSAVTIGGYTIENLNKNPIYVWEESMGIKTLKNAYEEKFLTDDYGFILNKYYSIVSMSELSDDETGLVNLPKNESIGAYLDYTIAKLKAYWQETNTDDSTYSKKGIRNVITLALNEVLNLKDKAEMDAKVEATKKEVEKLILSDEEESELCQAYYEFLTTTGTQVEVDNLDVIAYYGNYGGNYVLNFNVYITSMIGHPTVEKHGYSFAGLRDGSNLEYSHIMVWNSEEGIKRFRDSFENQQDESYIKELYKYFIYVNLREIASI